MCKCKAHLLVLLLLQCVSSRRKHAARVVATNKQAALNLSRCRQLGRNLHNVWMNERQLQLFSCHAMLLQLSPSDMRSQRGLQVCVRCPLLIATRCPFVDVEAHPASADCCDTLSDRCDTPHPTPCNCSTPPRSLQHPTPIVATITASSPVIICSIINDSNPFLET
jgi:hypothetical protein